MITVYEKQDKGEDVVCLSVSFEKDTFGIAINKASISDPKCIAAALNCLADCIKNKFNDE